MLGRTVMNPEADAEVVHGKESREVAYGDVVSFQQSGAGGYGDPLGRDPRRVLDDVLDEYVSVEAARSRYGVVIAEDDGEPTLDEAATLTLRAEKRGQVRSSALGQATGEALRRRQS
jgi:N-methylhydantoinase B